MRHKTDYLPTSVATNEGELQFFLNSDFHSRYFPMSDIEITIFSSRQVFN